MAIITEGTPALPTDGEGHITLGLRDDQGNFWFPRADVQHNLQVALWSPTGVAFLTEANPGVVESAGSNLLLLDQQALFGVSAPAGTVVNVDVNLPEVSHPEGWSYISFVNPSTASDMVLTFQNKETYTYSGTPQTLYATVGTFTVPKNTPNGLVHLVQGWLMGDGARLVVTNVSQIEAGGITCPFRIRKV